MKINVVGIVGEGKFVPKLQGLLSRAGFKVIAADLSGNYAEQMADVDLVLEVAPEDITVKNKVFKNCDIKCRKESILATTSSNPWITQLAKATKRSEKVIGLNFTRNPFEEKYLVQIVNGLQTSEETVRVVKEFMDKVGVTAVKLEENPGFILDRIIASIVNEAALMYSSKLATKEDIDKMMKVCVNWPMGPFEFADTLGVDRVVEILGSMSDQLGPKFQPCFLLRKMVDAGWLGKKTGRGFYTYS